MSIEFSTSLRPILLGIWVAVLTVGCGRVGFEIVAPDPMGCGDDCPEPGIYRSVGAANTQPLATGQSNGLLVVGTTAVFVNPMPEHVGVGDALQYDADDDGVVESLVFIHGRTTASVYIVATADGSTPPATASRDQDWSLYRAYISLADAVQGAPNPSIDLPFDAWSGSHDLVSLGQIWNLACYADGPDTSNTHVEGWSTSAVAYLRIFTPTSPFEVGVSQRHRGAWDPGLYHIDTRTSSSQEAIRITDATVRIDGLQLLVGSDPAAGSYPYGINLVDLTAGRSAHISNNIIRSTDFPGTTPFARAIKFDAIESRPILYAWNNVIYDFGGDGESRGIEITGVGSTAFIYNNTLANVFPAIYGNNDNDRLVVRNTVAIACGGGCVGGRGTFEGGNNRGSNMGGTGAPLPTDSITDYFRAADDFHLDPTAAGAVELVGGGSDLSADVDLAFDHDIDGSNRSGAWDIGADQR